MKLLNETHQLVHLIHEMKVTQLREYLILKIKNKKNNNTKKIPDNEFTVVSLLILPLSEELRRVDVNIKLLISLLKCSTSHEISFFKRFIKLSHSYKKITN